MQLSVAQTTQGLRRLTATRSEGEENECSARGTACGACIGEDNACVFSPSNARCDFRFPGSPLVADAVSFCPNACAAGYTGATCAECDAMRGWSDIAGDGRCAKCGCGCAFGNVEREPCPGDICGVIAPPCAERSPVQGPDSAEDVGGPNAPVTGVLLHSRASPDVKKGTSTAAVVKGLAAAVVVVGAVAAGYVVYTRRASSSRSTNWSRLPR